MEIVMISIIDTKQLCCKNSAFSQDAAFLELSELDTTSHATIYNTESSPQSSWTPSDFIATQDLAQTQGYTITDENFNSYEVLYSPHPTTPSTTGPPSLTYSTPEYTSSEFTPERSLTPSEQITSPYPTKSAPDSSDNLIHCPYSNCDKSFNLPHQFK